ncbi:Asp-tRNA(Asn)/Glu-tRNA(Gln) amidotransferase subunit GatA [Candidatus Bathycorpusculum sp.]|uniref:Asp-tRNA(Asn)/Glu-tRNA(Gln) amidotransferase subunit GatA n=1 Tax=Candidatus Bathycorpusculum sp. TaxID=2994959 RepID=UPI002822FC9F|nr:Asp-tRNA(Asn)/Glu-tRNA(Gln) amidotransferase subunit GatA [Candidatus Termitimicrobium sp.]
MFADLSLSSCEISAKIKNGTFSAEEYIQTLFERIERVDKKTKAYISIDKNGALEQAKAIDKKVKSGSKLGKLCGVGVAVKDSICTKNLRTTCGSRLLENYVSPFDATVVERIRREDAIIIGKTNMDEFGMGSSTENSYFGPTHNPWDTSMVPGGSSGGSATAVAALEATLSLGGDTGGSIRCPASFCGVVGLKPTYGLVSRYGLVSYANSLEQIGPISRNVHDSALLLETIAGYDPKDSTSAKELRKGYFSTLDDSLCQKVRIGIPQEFFAEGTDSLVKNCVMNAISKMENEQYITTKNLSLRRVADALPAYYIIAMSEASSNLARYDGIRYGLRLPDGTYDWSNIFSKDRETGFGQEVKRRIILGTFALSAGYYDQFYLKAQRIRTLISQDFERAFKEVDILVAPTMPILPFKIGEKTSDPVKMYLCDVDTVPVNLAGLPAISLPCGFQRGLPVGLQLIAPHFKEDLLLKIALSFERVLKVNKTPVLE